MTHVKAPMVLFCAAAGPRLGFGHLVRCGALAAAMGAPSRLVLESGSPVAFRVASRIGVGLSTGCHLLGQVRPALIVVDHPSRRWADRWVRRARAASIPVASVHDRGIGRVLSDLVIDGSLGARSHRRHDLAGTPFAILREDVRVARRLRPARQACTVLVALGGGGHIRDHGVSLARAIRRHTPRARVLLAPGFSGRPRPSLPRGCAWVEDSSRAIHALATATAAVVAGGVTLYEAAALGTPTVGVHVVRDQRVTVRRFTRARAALDAGDVTTPRGQHAAAVLIAGLLREPTRARRLGARARRLVDAGGAARVARALRALIRTTTVRGRRHAA